MDGMDEIFTTAFGWVDAESGWWLDWEAWSFEIAVVGTTSEGFEADAAKGAMVGWQIGVRAVVEVDEVVQWV